MYILLLALIFGYSLLLNEADSVLKTLKRNSFVINILVLCEKMITSSHFFIA